MFALRRRHLRGGECDESTARREDESLDDTPHGAVAPRAPFRFFFQNAIKAPL